MSHAIAATLPSQAAGLDIRALLARRRLLFGAAAAMMPRRLRAAPVRTLRMGFALGVKSHVGAAALALAEAVEHPTSGRFRIEHYPDSTLGGEMEILEGIADGEIDLALISGAPLATVLPAFGIFDVPFLFRDTAHAHAVLDGPLGEDYLHRLAAKRVVALAWGENGLRHITNSLHPVHGPEDLRGMHLRVPQSAVMMRGFQALGADPQQLAFPALYAALQTGRCAGQENPIAVIEAAHFAKVQTHLSLTAHVYSGSVFLMSQDLWGDLTPTDQDIFVRAARLAGAVSRQAAAEAEQNGVARLQQAGMQVVADIDRAAFAAAMASAMPEFARSFGMDQLDRIRMTQTASG